MNIKKFLLSALAGTVVMWLLAGMWHAWLMHDLYMDGVTSDVVRQAYPQEPTMHWVFLGYLILGLLMAWIYPKGVEGDNKIMNGLRFGAVMGLLFVLPHSIVMHGVAGFDSMQLIVIDGTWHLVEQGIGGIVIALIYGIPAGSKPASS